MRFPAEDFGRIRRREITVTLRPQRRQRLETGAMADVTISADPLKRVPLQRVDQIRTEFPVHEARTGERLTDAHGHPRSFILYEPKVTVTDEWVEISERSRIRLDEIDDEIAEAAGAEDATELADRFLADHGGKPDQIVWVIWFTPTTDIPRFLNHYGDYSHAPDGTDPLEVNDAEVLNSFAHKAHEHRSEDEAVRLERKLKELRKRAARTGVNVTVEVAVIRHQLEELERKVKAA